MGIDPSRGFVAIPRGLTDWEWYSNPTLPGCSSTCCSPQTGRKKQWQGITIHPGELVTSRAKLAKQLRMSEQSVRTALMHLQSTNCITSKAGPRYSVITINNYAEIIGSTKQSTSNQPAPNQDLTKITKKNKTVVVCVRDARTDSDEGDLSRGVGVRAAHLQAERPREGPADRIRRPAGRRVGADCHRQVR